MNYLLRGGRVIDPSQNLDATRDILIRAGRIAEIAAAIDPRRADPAATDRTAWTEVDCRNQWVVPGLIDMHTHLREPGFEYKETVQTGSLAARVGGFTAVACMPNTWPVNDNPATTAFILQKAGENPGCRVYPIAAVTGGSNGIILNNFKELKESGAVAFSDDGKPVTDSAVMRRALECASSLGMTIIAHCEDCALSAGGHLNEGPVSRTLGRWGIPTVAEDVMVARDILLCAYTGASLHIAHVSTRGAVHLIRDAKMRGILVTAEAAPHHFTLNDEALHDLDPNKKMNPPLRDREDLRAVREGLRDGTIDAIASDHAPHAPADKDGPFDRAAFGIIGLETSLALSLRLIKKGLLTPAQLVEKMSYRPAAILHLPGGTLRPGAAADLTVIDPHAPWTVEATSLRSRSRNTPFLGWSLEGRASLTLVDGIVASLPAA